MNIQWGQPTREFRRLLWRNQLEVGKRYDVYQDGGFWCWLSAPVVAAEIDGRWIDVYFYDFTGRERLSVSQDIAVFFREAA